MATSRDILQAIGELSDDDKDIEVDEDTLRNILEELDDEETPIYDPDADFSLKSNKKKQKPQGGKGYNDDTQDVLRQILTEDAHANDDDFFAPDDASVKLFMDTLDAESDQLKQQHAAKTQSSHSVVKEGSLALISEDLARKNVRANVGLPQVLKVANHMIAIGTSYGLILLFNYRQERKTILGSISGDGDNDHGGVSCMDFNKRHPYLLAGYERGHVIIWDIKSSTPVKKIIDAFVSPVNFIAFLHDQNKFVAADQEGLLKSFTLNKVLFRHFADVSTINTIDPRVDVDEVGQKTSIYAMSVLGEGDAQHPTDMYTLLAVASKTKLKVMSLRPDVRILHRIKRPRSALESSLPYISWREVIAPFGERPAPTASPMATATTAPNAIVKSRGLNPLLAVGWGQTLFVINVHNDEAEQALSFFNVVEMDLNFDVIGIGWLAERVLAVVGIADNVYQVSVIDPFAVCVVETVEAKAVRIVYHNRFDGNMTAVGSSGPHRYEAPAFHGSIVCNHNEGMIYIMGENKLLTLKIMTWDERINALTKRGAYDEALKLALDFYKGRGYATVGLPTEASKLHEIAGGCIAHLLLSYIDSMDTNPLYLASQSNRESEIKFFATLCGMCVEYCLNINRHDLLFGPIFDRFKNQRREKLFLDVLEPFIRDGQLHVLPKNILDILVEHYVSQNLIQKLEDCLLHLDPSHLDFNAVKGYCSQYRLFGPLVYIYTHVRDDYITPIQELIANLGDNSDTNVRNKSGAVLFDYLEKCFKGIAYPEGRIPEGRLVSIKVQIINFLFKRDEDTIKLPRPMYSMLKRLLEFNTKRFLNVIAIAFSDNTRFAVWPDTIQPAGPGMRSVASNVAASAMDVERPINRMEIQRALCETMGIVDKADPFIPLYVNSTQWPMFEHVVELFAFLARFIAQMVIVPSKTDLLYKIFTHLCKASFEAAEAEERQTHLVKILKLHPELEIQRERILNLAERARFQKVVAHLHAAAGDYNKVIESYLKEPSLHSEVFQYIQDTIAREQATASSSSQVPSAVSTPRSSSAPMPLSPTGEMRSPVLDKIREAVTVIHLDALMKIDSQQTAKLILEHFNSEQERILKLQNNDPGSRKILYTYLKALIEAKESNSIASPTTMSGASAIDSNRANSIDEDLQLEYIRLMCQFEPQNVYHYLTTHNTFKIDQILEICKNIPDATSYLRERTGDISGALSLLLKTVQEELDNLKRRLIAEAKLIDPNNTRFTAEQLSPAIVTSIVEDHPIQLPRTVVVDSADETNVHVVSAKADRKGKVEFYLPKINSVEVVRLPESKVVEEKLRLAIALCRRNTERKTLDDREVRMLWFSLLDMFVKPQRALRYGLLGQTVPADQPQKPTKPSKRRHNDDDDDDEDDSEDEDDLDDDDDDDEDDEVEVSLEQRIRENKTMIEDIHLSVQKLQDDLIVADSDEKKAALQKKIDRATLHLQQLRTRKLTLEREKREKDEEQRRKEEDPEAPHKVYKQANIWLQRCMAVYIRSILAEMVGCVPLPVVLNKIVQDHGKDAFGQFKGTITGMLDDYSYERLLLRTANRLLSHDTFSLGRQYFEQLCKALRPRDGRCGKCNRYLYEREGDDDRCHLFHCGHAFHATCLADAAACFICHRKEASDKNKDKSRSKLQQQQQHQQQQSSAQQTAWYRSTELTVANQLERLKRVNDRLSQKSRLPVLNDVDSIAPLSQSDIILGQGQALRASLLSLAPPKQPTRPVIGKRDPSKMSREPKVFVGANDLDFDDIEDLLD